MFIFFRRKKIEDRIRNEVERRVKSEVERCLKSEVDYKIRHEVEYKTKSKLDAIYDKLNDKNFNKFFEITVSPKKIFWRSFLAGVARGIGAAIGFSLLGALIIYLLRYIVMLNLPVIGAFIRDILEIVNS